MSSANAATSAPLGGPATLPGIPAALEAAPAVGLAVDVDGPWPFGGAAAAVSTGAPK
jgi:hypothetical protein